MTGKHLAALGIVAALASFALMPARGDAPVVGATHIAVASPTKIFNSLQETKDISQQRDATSKALEAERKQREQKVMDLQQALQLLKYDSPGYADKEKQFETESIEYKVWVETKAAEQQRDAKVQLKTLWDKVTAAVAEVATQKGYDLILADTREEFPDDFTRMTPEQLQQVVHARNVLYAAAQTDITQDVIAAMDMKYKASK